MMKFPAGVAGDAALAPCVGPCDGAKVPGESLQTPYPPSSLTSGGGGSLSGGGRGGKGGGFFELPVDDRDPRTRTASCVGLCAGARPELATDALSPSLSDSGAVGAAATMSGSVALVLVVCWLCGVGCGGAGCSALLIMRSSC